MSFEQLKEELNKISSGKCTVEGTSKDFTVYKRETEILDIKDNTIKLMCNGMNNKVIFEITTKVTEYIIKNRDDNTEDTEGEIKWINN